MKKMTVKGASTSMSPIVESIIDDLDDIMSHCQYTVSGSGDSVDIMNIVCSCRKKDPSYMPSISMKAKRENGNIMITAKMSFPSMNSEDLTYSDDMHYYTSQWVEITSCIDSVLNYSINEIEFMEAYDEMNR